MSSKRKSGRRKKPKRESAHGDESPSLPPYTGRAVPGQDQHTGPDSRIMKTRKDSSRVTTRRSRSPKTRSSWPPTVLRKFCRAPDDKRVHGSLSGQQGGTRPLQGPRGDRRADFRADQEQPEDRPLHGPGIFGLPFRMAPHLCRPTI